MKCCLCGDEIEVVGGWAEGHNAQPAADGRCCGVCNDVIVIPARLMEFAMFGGGVSVKEYRESEE